jgi:Na+/proline symporter
VTWNDVQQMTIIFLGLIAALVTTLVLLPSNVTVVDAVWLAGAVGKLNAVDLHFDWNNYYNVWSGLIGGTFLFLSYFGCDQSQVQRYLTGKSVGQSKLSLLFNAIAKIPMQFFILFIGAMVYVFYLFVPPPLLFDRVELARIRRSPDSAAIEQRYDRAFAMRKSAASDFVEARHEQDSDRRGRSIAQYRVAQKEMDAARNDAAMLVAREGGRKDFRDTNYIFLSFVTRFLPAGVVGLVIAVIFAAAMSASSGEINSLATVTMIDIYKRHIRRHASDHHYLNASRVATVFWGVVAIALAGFGKNLGSLIEAVNKLGSLFYGSLLGVFVLAFFFRRVGGTGAFWGMVAGEAAIFACFLFTRISYLWYNVIGCAVVVATAVVVAAFNRSPAGA